MKYEYLLIYQTQNTLNPRSGIEAMERFQRELSSAGAARWKAIEVDLENFRALMERPVKEDKPTSSVKVLKRRPAQV